MAEAGEKVETVNALWPQRRGAGLRAGRRKRGPGRGLLGVEGRRDSGTVPVPGGRGRQPALRGAGPSGTASLHRGGGGKMEAAEPGSGREGGFRSASDAAVEPRAVSLPRNIEP